MGGLRLELKQTSVGVNSYHKNTTFVIEKLNSYENIF